MWCRLLLLLAFLALSRKLSVNAGGSSVVIARVYVKFVTYSNEKGEGANGQCCDGRWSICETNGCDHTFRICFDRESGLNGNVFSCKYGSKQSSKLSNRNNIRFGDAFGNVRNPIQIDLAVIPESGNISMKVDVWDDDGTLSARDYVDTLRTLVSVSPSPRSTAAGIKSAVIGSRTKLSIQWYTQCADNIYGLRCQVACEPGEHFRCDKTTGKKICDKGWGGDDCNELMWCHNNPCINGGTCKARENGFVCTCARGWSGLNCEIQGSPCDLNPCLPGGCINYVSTYICVCPPDYIATGLAFNDSCVESPTSRAPSSTITTRGGITSGCVCPTQATPSSSSPGSSSVVTRVTDSPASEKVEFIDRPNVDCDRLAMNGKRYRDGVYTLHVSTLDPFPVYCDMSAEGWTVIQERLTGALDFYRSWQDYKNGFGEAGFAKEYFMGLEKIYYLTNQRRYKLRITMKLGDNSWRYANYEHFWVENEAHNYRLHVDGYSGNAGDALGRHNGDHFSTYDHDNDASATVNCASKYKSGWWFTSKPNQQRQCFVANLNGVYVSARSGWPACYNKKCVSWSTILNYETYSLLKTQMKVLPNPRF